MNTSINEFTKVNANLWNRNSYNYRPFATGVTPNGCWLIAPKMVELRDISIATGKDIYGSEVIEFDVTGTVNASNQYINSK